MAQWGEQPWIARYLEYTRHLEAPETFHFWSAISTIAGALRGKVWIDMHYWKWKPNFFIIYVAPPGIATKSTTIGVGTGFLRKIEGIHFGPESATWQAVTSAFAASTERVPLPSGGEYQMSSLTVVATELGTFLDPNNREMIDVIVDLWDGKEVPWKRATRSQGEIDIPNPWFNFIGATTPSWMQQNFNEYSIGGGFASRTVFIFADAKRHLQPYPSLVMDPADLLLETRLLRDLERIAQLAGPFTLTPDAYEWGEKWYYKHWGDTPEHLRPPRMQGYVARKQVHMHKLAMILSAAEGDTLEVSSLHLIQAERILTSIEGNMVRAFERVTTSKHAAHMAEILNSIRIVGGTIRKTDLWRGLTGAMAAYEFDIAVDGAIAAGYIRAVQSPHGLLIEAAEMP